MHAAEPPPPSSLMVPVMWGLDGDAVNAGWLELV